MAWYLNRALSNFRRAVDARWPNRDRASDGTIGDAAHQATTSDHNEDPDGSVDAWDMDVDGVDVWACIGAAIAHESIQYVIYNRKITSRSWGLGTWRDYTGSNPHDRHVHFNTRESHEDSDAPWQIGDDMAFTDNHASQLNNVFWSVGRGAPIIGAEGEGKFEAFTWWAGRVNSLLTTIAGKVDISPDEVAEIAAAIPAAPSAEENANAILAALDGRSPEQIADALRVVLGDQAPTVGQLLVSGTAA